MGWTGTQNVPEGGKIERIAEAGDLALIAVEAEIL